MIRLSTRSLRSGINYRLQSPSQLAMRSFSKEAYETPKGVPYSKLTVGVPKERFPLEKRVAATPEVRVSFCIICALVFSTNTSYLLIASSVDCIQTSQTRLFSPHRKRCRLVFLFQ